MTMSSMRKTRLYCVQCTTRSIARWADDAVRNVVALTIAGARRDAEHINPGWWGRGCLPVACPQFEEVHPITRDRVSWVCGHTPYAGVFAVLANRQHSWQAGDEVTLHPVRFLTRFLGSEPDATLSKFASNGFLAPLGVGG